MSTLPELLDHLASEFARKRVRVDHFLQDFDRLRTGYVSADQFRRGLSQLGVFMTPGEVDTLITAFTEERTGPDAVGGRPMVNYRNFTRCFQEQDLEKTPTKEIGEAPRGRRRLPVPGEQVKPEHQHDLTALFKRLRHAVRTRRLDVRQAMKDLDRHKRGTITLEQFRQGLNVFGRLSAPEFSLLQQAFEMKNGHVSYPMFCDMLTKPMQGDDDHSEDNDKAAVPLSVRSSTGPSSPDEVDIQALHRRLAAWVKERRQRLVQFFRDFDPTRKGIVSRGHFINVVHIVSGFPMNEHEMEALATMYALDDKTCEYTGLCDMLNKFGEIAALPPGEGRPMEDEGHEVAAQRIMQRLRTQIHADRIHIAPAFKQLDRTNQGLITKSQFEKTFRQFGKGFVEISSHDLSLLSSKFCGRDRPDLVKWTAFVAAMEEGSPTNPSNAPGASQGHSPHQQAAPLRGAGGMIQRTAARQQASQGQAPPVDEVLARVRQTVFASKLRLEEYLADHDRVRRGSIPSQQFRSTLDRLGVKFTEGEYTTIVDNFKAAQGTTIAPSIDWRRFCDTVNTVFDDPSLAAGHAGPRASVLTPRTQHIVRQLAIQCRAHGGNPYEQFLDVDPYKRGLFRSLKTFNMAFGMAFKPLNLQDRNRLFRTFGHPDDGGFNYRQFCKAMEQ
eukprot:TRINITY_DN2004_c0_g1_i2.p1 TRINITY_DN2004_c0_g1~~TRINITY_DN2004_c0_g1_i2.p1  ORF type:complete len:667 (+),score=87.63 TRINITY_DN2004_c0_g1_i2:92-2092(+)